jgi:uncharacterized protein
VNDEIAAKQRILYFNLRRAGRVAIAFSGGVDSTLLLRVAHDELGNDAIGIYCDSALQPSRERERIREIAGSTGAELIILEEFDLGEDVFRRNPENRCYLCKRLIFDRIIRVAKKHGFNTIADGSNADDRHDFRPGKKALLEMDVISPLQEAGLTKDEIRILSRHLGLPTWDKDALACLATRIPFHDEISPEKLRLIDGIEDLLVKRGYRNVRARLAGDRVSLEVRPDQVERLRSELLSLELEALIRNTSYIQIEIDPKGYRQGNMNKRIS